MKLDQEYLQGLLEAFESTEEGRVDIYSLSKQGFAYDDPNHGMKFRVHLEELRDRGFIEGGQNNKLGIMDNDEGSTWSVVPLRLISAGHAQLATWREQRRKSKTPTIRRLLEKLESRYHHVLNTSYGTCVSDRADFVGLVEEHEILQDLVQELPTYEMPKDDIHIDSFKRYTAYPEEKGTKDKAGYCWSAILKYTNRDAIEHASQNFPDGRNFDLQIQGLFQFLFTPLYNFLIERLGDIQAESSLTMEEYFSSELITAEAKRERIHTYVMTLSALHPRVIEVSAPLVRNGHYRQAILDAYIALEQAVREKAGLGKDINGISLMQTVFSADKSILKTSEDRNERIGLMYLFAGAMGAIRNERGHYITDDTDPAVALELLSLASTLFRFLDKAVKV